MQEWPRGSDARVSLRMDALEANKTFQHHVIDFIVEYDYTEDILLSDSIICVLAGAPAASSSDHSKSDPSGRVSGR